METLAGDVAAVLDALGIDRVALIGHSLGGYVALAFCRMYVERVTKLALVCSRLAADSEAVAREREELADRAEAQGRMESIADAYVPRLFAAANVAKRPSDVERAAHIARSNDVRGAAAMLRGMAQRIDSSDIAEELAMPVLIVTGAQDAIVPVGEAETMSRAFPNAALEVLPQVGHLPMLEAPDRLSRVLLAFAG